MKWNQLALAASLVVGGASFVRAEDPKPAATQTTKPMPVKDEPSVPSPKGGNDKQKAEFLKRHEDFAKDKAALLEKGPIQFVAIGDSITDGWRGRGKSVWAKTFGPWNAYNIGIGGDRTQHVLWRLDQGELDGISPNPKVAMIMIGTNNLGPNSSNDEIAEGVEKIVKETREKLPQTKVLLLGIFPRSVKATDKARGRIKVINERLSKLDDGGKTIIYLDIGDKFLTPEGELTKEIMPDALHPNEKGYEIWADAVKPVIEDMMK